MAINLLSILIRKLLCTFPILIILLSFHSFGQITLDKSLKQLEDPFLSMWKKKKKYFLIISASKTAGINTELPYAIVDAQKVRSTLLDLGYKEINTLFDNQVTRDEVIENLKKIRDLSEDSEVLVYYSGHGASSGKDLWLQLYGQKYFGESHGISANEILKIIREKYLGELVIVADACYSGKAIWTQSLSIADLGKTVILTSSSQAQESFPLDISPNNTMSAFTFYFLQGLTTERKKADENKDGIILFDELKKYVEAELLELMKEEPEKEMSPEIFGVSSEIWATYFSDNNHQVFSSLRKSITIKALKKTQHIKPTILSATRTDNDQQNVNLDPQETIALVKRIPENTDSYTKAVKAVAEEDYDKALIFLEQAEKENLVPLADIYGTRAQALVIKGQILEAIKWLEKAAQISDDPDLLLGISGLSLMAGDYIKAKSIIEGLIQKLEKFPSNSKNREIAENLLALAVFSLSSADITELKNSIKRIELLNVNEEKIEDLKVKYWLKFLHLFVSLFEADKKSVLKKAEEITLLNDLEDENPLKIMATVFLIGFSEKNSPNSQSAIKNFVNLWNKNLLSKDIDNLVFFVSMGAIPLTKFVKENSPKDIEQIRDLVTKTFSLFEETISKGNFFQAFPLLQTITNVEIVLENYDQAEKNLKRMLEITKGESKLLNQLIFLQLGNVYDEKGMYKEAEQYLKKALEIVENGFGDNSTFRFMISESLNNVLLRQNKFEEAMQLLKKDLELLQTNSAKSNKLSEFLIVERLEKKAEIYEKQKSLTEAENVYKNILMTFEIDNFERINILRKLGFINFKNNNFTNAESNFKNALDLLKTLSEPDEEETAIILFGLSEINHLKGKTSTEKESEFIELIKKLKNENESVISIIYTVANFYVENNKIKEAERSYNLILSIYEIAQPTTQAAVYYIIVGNFYSNTGNYQKAEELFLKAKILDESIYGIDHFEVGVDLQNLINLYLKAGKAEQARLLIDRTIKLLKNNIDEIASARSLTNTGFYFQSYQKFDESILFFNEALKLFEKNPRSDIAFFSNCLAGIGRVYYEKRNFEEAEKFYKRALALDYEISPPNLNNTVEDLRVLGRIYILQKKFQTAESFLRQAQGIAENNPLVSIEEKVQIYFCLAILYHLQDKTPDTNISQNKAFQIINSLTKEQKKAVSLWLKIFMGDLESEENSNKLLVIKDWEMNILK